ncbi:porin [Algoriphagus boritolerans]|uniref:Putative beta-barrel porin-2, OmpL-like. bbp2 n=1 Tax=Algoriphagus boritolerans DSM 17298 = JCM 18970 TaxID=1120964 RepID=A0A1H5U0S5_9BACT|nr:porin [Algoriphagus boritolerans]SEF68028.1 Putative beta-barrel porin-2, OmpL-like. bbp2 [Algoriphagus boritolerans DSM 17298 = JCM 18970]
MRTILFIILILAGRNGFAQNQADSSWSKEARISLSGFADVFYVYDFNQPESIERQTFLFNHNRHNELNLNLGLLKLSLNHSKYRANFALQAGTYSNDNYAAEPGLLKNIFEANIGISLTEKNNLWLDAGIMPSHIGFESAISTDNWTLTRSILAENSPYFLSGAKLTFYPNDKWEVAGLILNGWQRIQRLEGNSLPSIGTQLKFSPTESTTLNWSTFIGTDDPDLTRRMRYFNNFYAQFKLTERFGLITGLDLGIQQRSKGSSEFDFWYSPVLIGQFTVSQNWKAAIRAEYYQDQTGIIIPTETINGFRTSGLSLNMDYSPTPAIFCRIEGRWMTSEDAIFERNSNLSKSNFMIGTSIAIRFSAIFK